jgi:hypothetical protein
MDISLMSGKTEPMKMMKMTRMSVTALILVVHVEAIKEADYEKESKKIKRSPEDVGI